MSRKQVSELKPFLSVLIVVMTLFSMVFFKMEVRRMGYLVLKETRQYKVLRDRYRLQVMQYAKITQPERVRQLALSQLTLTDARMGQIIQLTGQKIALPQ